MQENTDRLIEELRLLREENARLRAALSSRPDALEPGPEGLHTAPIESCVVCAAIRDVSDRLQAEDALRESERRYHELAEFLPQTVYETDATGRLTFVNENAYRMWGYTREDFAAGLNALQMIAPEDRARAQANIVRSLAGDLSAPNEYLGVRKDGSTFPVMIHASPIIRNGRPVGLRGIIVDITERRRLEEQLLQARKLESIGRLAGGVAHDFNNLLTALFGYAEMALAIAPAGGHLRSHLQGIQQVSERAATLTRQLLAFARKQVIQPEVLDLNAVLGEMQKLLRRVIGEDVDLVCVPGANPSFVRVDPGNWSRCS